VIIEIPDDKINDLQFQSIKDLLRMLKQAHFTDIRVRIYGEYKIVQADWLKHMRFPKYEAREQ
jgi:hypothetical protein